MWYSWLFNSFWGILLLILLFAALLFYLYDVSEYSNSYSNFFVAFCLALIGGFYFYDFTIKSFLSYSFGFFLLFGFNDIFAEMSRERGKETLKLYLDRARSLNDNYDSLNEKEKKTLDKIENRIKKFSSNRYPSQNNKTFPFS